MLLWQYFCFGWGAAGAGSHPKSVGIILWKKDSRKAVLFSAEVTIRMLAISALSGHPFCRALAEKKAWPNEFLKNSGQRIFTALPLEKSPCFYRQVCAERNGKSIEIKILFGNPVILKSFEQKRTVAHLDPLEPD